MAAPKGTLSWSARALSFHVLESGREGRRPAWLRKDLLIKLKIEMHRQWKQEHIHWE